MLTFHIPANQMAIIVLALGFALAILFTLAVYELEQLAKQKKRGPWNKK